MNLLILLVALLGADTTDRPVDVYASLDGTWQGTFIGWSLDGVEQYRIDVRQTYRTIDANTQTVEITDRMADGTVITGTGQNIARRLADGTLELICIVEKSNGDRVEHKGRLIEDIDGQKALVWYSDGPGRQESFREAVRGDLYAIDGMGRYGKTMYLMAGRYERVE
ncbi:MAG: hypothetical protein AAGD38_01130 [Acidobacteriota bacterium]